MQLDKTKLKELMATPLTNDDLERYFGPQVENNIMKYSELSEVAAIEDILPTDKSYKILLLETKLNSGHWICVLRYNNTIEVFNSYGCKPSRDDFCYVPKLTNLLLGQTQPFLNLLLNAALKEGKFNIVYNKRKFQKLKEGINTCGRWVILRILTMTEFSMNLEQFIKFIERTSINYKLPSDYIVSSLIT